MRRVLLLAIAICVFSFIAGVAGDLSRGPVAEAATASVAIPALEARAAPIAAASVRIVAIPK